MLAGGEYDDSVGFYVQPTIVETTTPDDKIFKEEIFGPLLTVLVYKDKVSKVLCEHDSLARVFS